MADIEELLASLTVEQEADEIDWDAPEAGSFPPQVYPGRHRFMFALDPQTPFDTQEYEGKRYLRVNFTAKVQLPEKSEPVDVRFQRANMIKFEGRPNHDVGELLRCLGVRTEDSNPRTIITALQQADGRASGEAVFGWEAFAKDTNERITTNARSRPNKKTGKLDIPWPKGADNKYLLTVKFPESGDTVYGRERIVSYKLPK